MTEKELAKELRAFRAERKRLERAWEAQARTYEVEVRLMTRDDVLKLLLEALEADEPLGSHKR
jgi:hypothetical protein